MNGTTLLACGAVLCALAVAPLDAQQRTVLPARDNPLPGTPADIHTVGRDEGEDYELFASVTAVGFDARDNLYVLDRGNHRVVVFDARGRHVRTVGKRGDGPGEFALPAAMAVGDDGSIVIADFGRTSLSVFDADGNYRGVALPADGGRPAGGSPMFRDANGVVVRTMSIDPAALARGGPTMMTPITRFTLDANATARTMFEIPQPAPTVTSPEQGRTMVVMAPPVFSPQPFWALLPNGGVAVAHEPTYTIRLTDAGGRVQRIVERAIEPRRVTRDDRERALEQRAENMRSGANTQTVRIGGGGGATFSSGAAAPADREQMLRNTTFADVIPVISRFTVDRFGRMWVARSGRRVGDRGPVDLIAADGRYIGTISPQAVPDAVSASGRAAYIETDELGVARVAVRSLPASWR